MNHAEFLKVVEILHGDFDKAQAGGENTQRSGGLWDQIVTPRQSVLQPELTAEDRAILKFYFSGNRNQHAFRPIATMVVGSTLVDFDFSKKKNYPRHGEQVAHLSSDGQLCIGTMHAGGGWQRTSSVKGREGLIVDGVHAGDGDVTPLGISRRADREGAGFCLVTGRESTGDERRLARRTLALLEEVRDKKLHPTGMPKMDFLVVADPQLILRADDELWADCEKARRATNVGVAKTTATGRWGIPGVPHMICDMVGEVSKVDGFTVVVSDGNRELKYEFDPAAANAIASERTGLDLPFVQPIVRTGQKVMPGCSLFGPWPIQRVDANDVPALCAKLGGDLELTISQVRAWYTLAQAKRLCDKQLGYPLELVVPTSLRNVFVKVEDGPHIIAAPAEDRRDRFTKFTPVRNRLKTGSTGFEMDLYDTSLRRQMVLDITRPKAQAKSSRPTKRKSKSKSKAKAKRAQ